MRERRGCEVGTRSALTTRQESRHHVGRGSVEVAEDCAQWAEWVLQPLSMVLAVRKVGPDCTDGLWDKFGYDGWGCLASVKCRGSSAWWYSLLLTGLNALCSHTSAHPGHAFKSLTRWRAGQCKFL